MADVNIHQPQTEPGSSGAGWIVAIVALVLLAVIAWFVLGPGTVRRDAPAQIDIDVPAATSPSPSAPAEPSPSPSPAPSEP